MVHKLSTADLLPPSGRVCRHYRDAPDVTYIHHTSFNGARAAVAWFSRHYVMQVRLGMRATGQVEVNTVRHHR